MLPDATLNYTTIVPWALGSGQFSEGCSSRSITSTSSGPRPIPEYPTCLFSYSEEVESGHPFESKINEELFELAFEDDGERDDDYEAESAWAAIRVLRRRNTPEVFALAKQYCASPVARHRERGLQVLAQLGAGQPIEQRRHVAESVELAIAGTRDSDTAVLPAAAWALAHLDGHESKTALIRLKNHSDPDVRYAVAFGLVMEKVPGVVPTLLELMDDNDDKVRNWATYALGQSPEHDSPEIREAFRRRLSDSFEEAREEAIWGLAKRKDRQGLALLLKRFDDDSWVQGDEQAARDVLEARPGEDLSIDKLCDGIRALAGQPL